MSRETEIKSKMILPVWTVRSELHTKANTLWQHGLKFKNKTPQPTTKFSFSQDHVILLTRTFRIRWKRKKKPNCSQFIKSWGSETMEYIRGLFKTVLYCAIMRSYIHNMYLYLLSFPRFWTLSIERFWFLFWSILNGVTLKTSNRQIRYQKKGNFP